MTYDEFVATMRIRAFDALNTMRDSLITAGVSSNNIVVEEVDSTNLRFRLTARRGARTIVAYFELTPVGIIDGEMSVVITLYVEGNGAEITHSYTVGTPLKAFSQISLLLDKLTNAEQTVGEVTVKARAFLQV